MVKIKKGEFWTKKDGTYEDIEEEYRKDGSGEPLQLLLRVHPFDMITPAKYQDLQLKLEKKDEQIAQMNAYIEESKQSDATTEIKVNELE